MLLAIMAAACCMLLTPAGRAADGAGWAGRIDGCWHWRLPPTANGLQPYVSWHATGSAPNGDIYVAAMDHVTNSALYRLAAGSDRFVYVGDARAASETAGNWQPGETAEKFHTRPTWLDGKVYVATMDYSKIDDGYLARRGFHWYAYDSAADNAAGGAFTDLSATEPGGVGAPHVGIVTIAADPWRNILYGAAAPTGQLLRFDPATNRTNSLGRPQGYDRDNLYVGRFMWVDSRGRLYFSAGNASGFGGPYDPAIYRHLRFYEPGVGFGERQDWALQGSAIETGQCTPDHRTCWLADDHSHVYRFEDEGPRWSYLGQIVPISGSERSWVFAVSPDGRFAYAVRGMTGQVEPAVLYEFDLATATSRKLCSVTDLEPALAGFDTHTGYGSWDDRGRFYFVSFPSPQSPKSRQETAIVTAIDPMRLKQALNLTPSE